MTLKNLSEIVWRLFQSGRSSATNQSLRQADIDQMCRMGFGIVSRKRYFEGKADNEGTDFFAGSLDEREYDLSESDINGRRSAVIPVTDNVMRLPKNSDITNVYPVADGECSESISGEVTQVMPGEENFYLDIDSYLFFVQKGKRIDTYHLPPCIKKIKVERIYIDDDVDISLDVASEIAMQVLGVSLNIKEFFPVADNSYDSNKNQLRYQIEQMEAKK